MKQIKRIKCFMLAACMLLMCSVPAYASQKDKAGTCYEVFIYSFCDSDGDGIGDIQGLISRLDYIQELGFDSIWLLPVHQSATYHKYDVIDYYSIDKEYGTMQDFDQLIEECSRRGIRIFMDMVINHTSAQHEWFKTACDYIRTLKKGETPDYKVCPYAEYYNFEYLPDGKVPDSYSSVEGADGWYYECVFWDQMPDLDLECESVRKELEKAADFWIEKGVMGFRMDAALHYSDSSRENSIQDLKWFYDYVENKDPQIYVVAEVWDSFNTIAQFYESGVDSIFDYVLGGQSGLFVKTVNRLGNSSTGMKLAKNLETIDKTFHDKNPQAIDGVFLSNHDTGRAAGFLNYDLNKLKLAAGLEMMTSGCAFVYYGDEIGMSGSGIDENKRAPMYWDDEGTGMTKGPQNMQEQKMHFPSCSAQQKDEYSLYNYYKAAIQLRNTIPELETGTMKEYEYVTKQNGNICALIKASEENTVYVLANISAEEASVEIDDPSAVKIAGELETGEEKAVYDDMKLTIPAYGIVVLGRSITPP